jgi:DNA polymerase-3 subunit beta
MKLVCVKEKLQKAVSLAEKITTKAQNLPILQSILLLTEGNTLKIRATNLDIGVEFEIPAKIEKKGVASIPGSVLSNTLSTLQNTKNISINLINNNLFLSTSNSSITIKSYPPDDFPTLPTVKDGEMIVIPVKKLNEGIKSVLFSAAISDIKPEISSVFIYPENDHIVFVATDSFRLAEKKVQNKKTKEIPPIIVPLKNINEVSRITDGADGDITIYANKNQISMYYDGVYITSRIINGVFPDYKQIIPKNHTTEVIVLKQDLINALKISNIFSDKFHKTNFVIHPNDKIFEINTQNAEVGENTTKVDAALTGDLLEISFNHKYILDCLQFIKEDSISMQFNGENKPMTLRGLGDNSFLYLVMPINK